MGIVVRMQQQRRWIAVYMRCGKCASADATRLGRAGLTEFSDGFGSAARCPEMTVSGGVVEVTNAGVHSAAVPKP